MNTVFMFQSLSNDGRLEDIKGSDGKIEDENWFKTREEAIAWLEIQESERFDGDTLILTEMFFQ